VEDEVSPLENRAMHFGEVNGVSRHPGEDFNAAALGQAIQMGSGILPELAEFSDVTGADQKWPPRLNTKFSIVLPAAEAKQKCPRFK